MYLIKNLHLIFPNKMHKKKPSEVVTEIQVCYVEKSAEDILIL